MVAELLFHYSKMKIATWNVNSINSRLEHLIKFLKRHQKSYKIVEAAPCVLKDRPKISESPQKPCYLKDRQKISESPQKPCCRKDRPTSSQAPMKKASQTASQAERPSHDSWAKRLECGSASEPLRSKTRLGNKSKLIFEDHC